MFAAVPSIKRFVSKTFAGKKALVLAAAAALSVPALAHADYRYDRGRDDRTSGWRTPDRHDDRRDDRRDYDHSHGGTNIGVDIRIGDRAPRPEYRDREVQVWVPATYR